MKRILFILLIFSCQIYSQENIDYEYRNNLYEKSLKELKILRNEFFAKKGYKFKSKELENYFNQFDWYEGTKSIDEIVLTKNEELKVNYIKELENKIRIDDSKKDLLKILTKIPEKSMATWEWSESERKEYIEHCIEKGYLINDNSGMMRKTFISDNHLFIQVIDGTWELYKYSLNEKESFIITIDIAGGGEFIQMYKYESDINELENLELDQMFSHKFIDLFVPNNIECKDLKKVEALRYEIKKEFITIFSYYEDECLLEREFKFKFNKEKLKYELVK